MNDFHEDNNWQREKRDAYLSDFYGEYALNGRYVYIEKSHCSTLMQKRLAVDTVLQSRKGGSLCIEEKIVRKNTPPHWRFALETDSCTVLGHESDGWMKYGEADYLLYCFEVERSLDLDCYIVPFQPLRTWFWKQNIEDYYMHTMPTRNRSVTRLVPTCDVVRAVGATRFLLGPDCAKRNLDPKIDRRVEL